MDNITYLYIPPNVSHVDCCRGDDVRHESISVIPIPFDDGHACVDCCPCPDCGEYRAEQYDRDPSGWANVQQRGSWKLRDFRIRGRRRWLLLGSFICISNVALAVVALMQRDLFLFFLGVCVAVFVGIPLWERREYLFRRGE